LSKQKETKLAINKYLRLHPESRFGRIWADIKDQDGVGSMKLFSRYLAELVDDGQVTKKQSGVDKHGKIISDRVPRYSRTKWVEVEKKRAEQASQIIGNIRKRIENIQGNFDKLNNERLALQFYWFYSSLNEMRIIKRIELAHPKWKTSREIDENVKKTIPKTVDYLFTIIKKLPEKRRDEVLENLFQLAREKIRINHKQMYREAKTKIGKKHFV
jgi:hypothetical protein